MGARSLVRRHGGAAGVVVALRTADPRLVAQVRAVVDWWDAEVVVRAPGSPPPPADVHLDSPHEREPGDPVWSRTAALEVGLHPGADGVIVLPGGADELADAVAAALARRTTRVIGVVGARGGVGASVTAALVARALAEQDREVALVDLAGGLDVLLAVEDEPGPRWADLDPDSVPFVGSQLAGVLPAWCAVPVLAEDQRGRPGGSDLIEPVLTALRQQASVVVCDLGREEVVWCDDVVVVTSGEPASVVAAQALIARLGPQRCHLVLRRVPGLEIAPAVVAEACETVLAGVLPHARSLTADVARGASPGDRRRSALWRAARRLALTVAPA